MIELSGLYKYYSGHIALKNINLFIPEGEIFGIIGKSGAGKSTLLRCINLLEKPETGNVIINNQPITNLPMHNLRIARHDMAMIFQHFNLINSKNVYDNIAIPMRIQRISETDIKHKIAELLPLVELEDKAHAYPAQLSGGQKQRVAIARALSCAPKILLCDEATSALDPETTESILKLLAKINKIYGITIVLITHEMDVVKRICHRIAVMESGEIVENTTLSDAIHTKNSIARAMLYKQLSPELPACLTQTMTETPTDRTLLKIFFEGNQATSPFISQASRELIIDITILLANIDRIDGITYGVLVVEISAPDQKVQAFINKCEQVNLTVETVGYVTNI